MHHRHFLVKRKTRSFEAIIVFCLIITYEIIPLHTSVQLHLQFRARHLRGAGYFGQRAGPAGPATRINLPQELCKSWRWELQSWGAMARNVKW